MAHDSMLKMPDSICDESNASFCRNTIRGDAAGMVVVKVLQWQYLRPPLQRASQMAACRQLSLLRQQ